MLEVTSLYERLGGVEAITAVVDAFVVSNPLDVPQRRANRKLLAG